MTAEPLTIVCSPRLDATEGGRWATFLDRDGVINAMVTDPEFGLVDSPANSEQFRLLPGVGAAIAALNRLGGLVVVVSNQPGIAKGKLTPELLAAMDRKMVAEVGAAGGTVDAIIYCLHHPEASLAPYRMACSCRKPKAGLLTHAAREWGIDLARSFMVGDGVTDIAAGQAAGAKTIFLSSRKCYICDALLEHGAWPDFQVPDLPAAAAVIVQIVSGDVDASARSTARCGPPGGRPVMATTTLRP